MNKLKCILYCNTDRIVRIRINCSYEIIDEYLKIMLYH